MRSACEKPFYSFICEVFDYSSPLLSDIPRHGSAADPGAVQESCRGFAGAEKRRSRGCAGAVPGRCRGRAGAEERRCRGRAGAEERRCRAGPAAEAAGRALPGGSGGGWCLKAPRRQKGRERRQRGRSGLRIRGFLCFASGVAAVPGPGSAQAERGDGLQSRRSAADRRLRAGR